MAYSIFRGSLAIPLTGKEIEDIFRYREHQYMLQDAVTHILNSLEESDREDFFLRTDTVNIRDEVIELYTRWRDCNVPENDTWELAVKEVLSKHKMRYII